MTNEAPRGHGNLYHDVPAGVGKLYSDLAQKETEERSRREQQQKVELEVQQVFNQGQTILDEYGNESQGYNETPGEVRYPGITVFTPNVDLQSGDKLLSFRLYGFRDEERKRFKYITADTTIDHQYLPILRVSEFNKLQTPVRSGVNDPEVIEVGKSLFDAIEQSLSERFIRKSKIPKPQAPKPTRLDHVLKGVLGRK